MTLSKTQYEVIKFIIVGGINTLNYYIVYLILLKLLGINYLVSHISGFIISFIISYYLNCYFVYKVTPTLRKFIKFPLTQVVNMGMQTLLLYVFVQWFHISSVIAPFAGLIITIPITFVLSKYLLKD
ncbi:GtrA family protein [Staphylococcus caeli]|uniref:Sugar translocase in surface polysaccharides biosynthesis n=1 Tax=Staphylococcus caeli TaxID=2201815 RepID=A0A1D4L916_9STAP|nr:GtrA family protein [Staphylococcus caeli]SCS82808.1 sugar translocase in surface polysaccharides biosynthesis [Staphylococcus caeli]SCS91410.1 sugar translocase in surface polysaccharides biosynthesis [Staphylococcus caeli]